MENKNLAIRQLPKLDDLYGDILSASKQNDLNRLLNSDPKPEWIFQNQYANNSNYIKVATIEYLLTSIFIQWRVEVKTVQVIANSVVVTVRLHIMNPVSGEWDWQDGIGASPIQTKAGAAATDFGQVNNSAVQMAAPAAETFAFKDAAEKLGRLFGKDINRKDEMNYGNLDKKFASMTLVEIPDELRDIIGDSDGDNLTNIYRSNPEYHSNPEFMKLLNARREQINGTK